MNELMITVNQTPGTITFENYEEVKATMDASVARGVAVWQANFRIMPDGVTLQKVMPVAL